MTEHLRINLESDHSKKPSEGSLLNVLKHNLVKGILKVCDIYRVDPQKQELRGLLFDAALKDDWDQVARLESQLNQLSESSAGQLNR